VTRLLNEALQIAKIQGQTERKDREDRQRGETERGDREGKQRGETERGDREGADKGSERGICIRGKTEIWYIEDREGRQRKEVGDRAGEIERGDRGRGQIEETDKETDKETD
jgi:hypothetical protein